ncbi:MAG: hypothetical protein ACD_46C00125G0009 [uncultured bacterium]|nr:MAG: hypothetical protein ACD_46C00125G0009 [uncultured bacterium]
MLRKFFLGSVSTDEKPNPESIDKTLNIHATLNKHNAKGDTALHLAIKSDNLPLTKSLATSDTIHLNEVNLSDETPLFYAVTKPIAAYTEALLANKTTKINILNKRGLSPLHIAVANGNEFNVKKLLEYGANPNLMSYPTSTLKTSIKFSSSSCANGTPLHTAFQQNNLSNEIIESLIFNSKPANINEKNILNQTPFFIAMGHQSLNELSEKNKYFILKTGDMNVLTKSNESILHAAARNKKMPIDMFKMLIDYNNESGVNRLLQIDNLGESPLYCAIANDDTEKANRILAQQQPDGDIYDENRKNPLHAASKNNNLKLAKGLINKFGIGHPDSYLDIQDKSHRTPLQYASINGNVDMISFFYKKDKTCFEGESAEEALRLALVHNKPQAVAKLIECGVNPDVHVNLGQSFEISSSLSSFSSISDEELIDETGILENGDTPLHYAVKKGDIALAKLCLEKSPYLINSSNKENQTPAFFAIDTLSPEMAYLLWSKGSKILESVSADTLLLHAASKGFTSEDDIKDFFQNPEYKLSQTQLTIKNSMGEENKKNINMHNMYAKYAKKVVIKTDNANEVHRKIVSKI